MSDTQVPRERRKIPWWMWPTLVIAIVFTGWAFWNMFATRAIETELQAIRDAGYPATPEELNAWYKYPDGKNAADVYMQAIGLLVPVDEADEAMLPLRGEADLPPLGQPLPEDMLEAIQRDLTANEPAIAKLHEAAEIDGSRYPIDLTLGLNITFPALTPLRQSAHLLLLEAMLRTERGEVAGAIDSLDAVASIARSLRNEPNMISHLVQVAINAMLLNGVERMVNTADVSMSQIGQLDQIIIKALSPQGMTRAMAGERAGMHTSIRNPSMYGAIGLPMKAYQVSGLIKRDQLLYLQMLGEQVKITEQPLSDQLALVPDRSMKLDNIPRSYPMARLLLPSLGRAVVIDHRKLMTHRATLTALAILRYQHANGRAPDSLDALVPDYLDAVPLDTFTGKPIEYERINDESFILFTPGDLDMIVPSTGATERVEFIRNLNDQYKFEYRVPTDSPLRVNEDEQE